MSGTGICNALAWSARALGAISLAVLGLFVVAHLIEEQPAGGAAPTEWEWLGLSFFPGGVIVGLLLAFAQPRGGSFLVLASLLGFYVWHYASSGHFATGHYFLMFASPSFVYLLAELCRGKSASGHLRS